MRDAARFTGTRRDRCMTQRIDPNGDLIPLCASASDTQSDGQHRITVLRVASAVVAVAAASYFAYSPMYKGKLGDSDIRAPAPRLICVKAEWRW